MRVKRTSTLQVGPILQEKNDHTVKRETLQEEGSRQLAAARRELVQDMVDTANEMDEVAGRLARQVSDDLDEMVVQSFAQPGVYIAPVANREGLLVDAEEGSICLTTDTGEVFVRTGQAWVSLDVESQGSNRFLRTNESG